MNRLKFFCKDPVYFRTICIDTKVAAAAEHISSPELFTGEYPVISAVDPDKA